MLSHEDYIPIDRPIPAEPLIVLNGWLHGKAVKVLQDDRCNTNVVLTQCLRSNRKVFKIAEVRSCVNHPQKDTSEESEELIISGTLKLGTHVYTYNWVVASGRYDVLLGMPWHVAHNPRIDYVQRIVQVDGDEIPVDSFADERVSKIQVTNLSVKKFRRLLRTRSKSNDFQLFQAFQVNTINGYNGKSNCNPKLEALLQQYHDVFKTELPKGLLPERAVDHEIEIEDGAKTPHRPLFQLSPAELVACKEYVQDLLKKGKIRPSRSPFRAPLFFVKNQDKRLRGVADYRSLNRITKRNNAPLPTSDEMFDRLGGATVFSNHDLKTGSHQIRVRPDDIEKSAFNT